MFVGYVLLLLVGVVAVTVIFYVEDVGQDPRGLTNHPAEGHYILMNSGAAAAMFLMIWGGWGAGCAAAAVSQGGLGLREELIHVQYLGQLVDPIGALVILAALGAVLGGLGFIMRGMAR
jgi:hypothetical protein